VISVARLWGVCNSISLVSGMCSTTTEIALVEPPAAAQAFHLVFRLCRCGLSTSRPVWRGAGLASTSVNRAGVRIHPSPKETAPARGAAGPDVQNFKVVVVWAPSCLRPWPSSVWLPDCSPSRHNHSFRSLPPGQQRRRVNTKIGSSRQESGYSEHNYRFHQILPSD
jgi:hypothetical protein